MILRIDGRVEIPCQIPTKNDLIDVNRVLHERHLVFASLVGKDADQANDILASKVYFSGVHGGSDGFWINLKPVEPLLIKTAINISEQVGVHYGLSNFYFLGCEATRTDDGFKVDKFRSSIRRFDMLFKQHEDFDDIIATLEESGKVLLTSELIVHTEPDRLEELDRVVMDALLLLSFATGSWIGIIYRDVLNDRGLIESRFGGSKLLPYRHFDFVINARNMNGCQLKEYLERSYPAFLSIKASLGIDTVLEWTVSAKLGSHLEITYLVTELALESLASHIPQYLEEKGIKVQSGSVKATRAEITNVLANRKYELPTDILDEIASVVSSKEVGLRDRLRALLQYEKISFREDELEFTRVRSQLIHTGRFQNYAESMTEYQRLANFVNRIVLSLLGCYGLLYFNVAEGYVEEPVPSPSGA